MLAGCQIGPDGKFSWNQKENPISSDIALAGDNTGNTTSPANGSALDKLTADNESLHAELAKARQQFRVTASELDLIKQQLKEANDKLANNQPRYSTASDQGREANNRIELIIYPETY